MATSLSKRKLFINKIIYFNGFYVKNKFIARSLDQLKILLFGRLEFVGEKWYLCKPFFKTKLTACTKAEQKN